MKEIIFKVWTFPKLSETFIINQIALSIRLGYNVKILVGELNEISENSDSRIFQKYGLKKKIIIDDYKIPKKRWKRYLKSLQLIVDNLVFLPQLIEFYKSSERKDLLPLFEFSFYKQHKNADIFHIQYGTNKHPIEKLKKIGFLKSKIIVSFHGHDLHFPINGLIPNNGYYKTLFQTASKLVVNTPYLENKLLDLNAEKSKIETIPIGIDTDYFKPKKGSAKREVFEIITVGRLEYLKGQAVGIECIKELVNRGFQVKYTIVGDGREFQNLKNLIKKYNLKSSVTMVGAKHQSEIKTLLQNSDLFLMTSITDLNTVAETQGLVTAEAQSCGVPVIAFDTGGVKYTIKNGYSGFICQEGDIGNYIEKIESLIRKSELREKMKLNARDFILENFSLTKMEKKWATIYNSI